MSRLSHFGATDISALFGSGITMSRVESCCTRLCFRSWKRFANHVCSGRFGKKLGGRFSKNRFVLSRRSEFYVPSVYQFQHARLVDFHSFFAFRPQMFCSKSLAF
jgi:hypothetical protein